jgi:hypothetical protein
MCTSLSMHSVYAANYCFCSEHMIDVCTNRPQLIPKFVYATESYLGSPREMALQQNLSSGSYQCCTCEGDCATNPNCQCIMRCVLTISPIAVIMTDEGVGCVCRNGQRSPYSSDGRFDFCKGKIFECGPYCSCNKSQCSLRLTQRGVSLPLVVCRMGAKGYGVMATKV